MAIQHMDNWSMYGRDISYMTNGVYGQVDGNAGHVINIVADPDGITAGSVLQMAPFNNNGGILRYIWPSPQTTMGQACRIWLNAIPSNINFSEHFFEFRNASNLPVIYGRHNTVGGINVYDGTNTLLGQTTGPVITANAWWHHEIKVNTTAGTCEIRVEGVPVLNLTGLTLTGGPLQQAAFFSTGDPMPIIYWKDLVWWDGSGTRNTDFLGSVIVYSMSPSTDVSVPWGIVGNTSGHAILNNSPPLDTTQYLTADYPSIPGQMSYGLTPLPSNVTTVRGLMTFVRAKKIDGGDGNLQNGLLSSGVQGNGANRPITAAFTYWRDVFETDPHTSDTWTVSAANAADLTMNRTV